MRSAASATEALSVLADWAPDAILLDVMMPGMDGPALAARIREDDRLTPIPIIFMTARARGSDIAGYRADGVAGVIVKPFDPLTLASELRAIVRSAQ